MNIQILMRFAVGFAIGACIWVLAPKARAETIPATQTTENAARRELAAESAVVRYPPFIDPTAHADRCPPQYPPPIEQMVRLIDPTPKRPNPREISLLDTLVSDRRGIGGPR